MKNQWTLVLGFAAIFSATVLAQNAIAQVDRQLEYKIDTKMFVGDSTSPVSRNKTVFADGLIFDFSMAAEKSSPDEIMIYDFEQKTVCLLDMKRQVQLKLLDLQIEKMLAGMRDQMRQDDRSRLLLEQSFEESVDAEAHSVVLTGSQNMTYRLVGRPVKSQAFLSAYIRFLDVFTRTQASDPKKFPPFARLRLNESIGRVGWVPSRVDVTIAPGDFFKQSFRAHTTHQLNDALDARDRAEIEFAKKNWGAFPEVDLAEYRGLVTQRSFFAKLDGGDKASPNGDQE